MKPRQNIVLVTGRWRKDHQTIYPAQKLLTILKTHANSITWIATKEGGFHYHEDNVHIIGVPDRLVQEPFYMNLFYYVLHQIRVASLLIDTGRDPVIFAFGSDLFILPIIFGKIMGKEVILRTDGRPSTLLRTYKNRTTPLKERLFETIEWITYATVNLIVPESLNMVWHYSFEKYQRKIEIGSLYVNSDLFNKFKILKERRFQIGFVGRLSEEKGILQFAKFLSENLLDSGLNAVIIGDGPLKLEMDQILLDSGIQNQVVYMGRVDNRDLPQYLNEIRVVVVPSAFEGLPNIVLESMACGCVVLATPVGGIPDLIHDGITGFLLEDQSPEAIARGIFRACTHDDCDKIAESARRMIEQNYTLSAAVERYGRIFRNTTLLVKSRPEQALK